MPVRKQQPNVDIIKIENWLSGLKWFMENPAKVIQELTSWRDELKNVHSRVLNEVGLKTLQMATSVYFCKFSC